MNIHWKYQIFGPLWCRVFGCTLQEDRISTMEAIFFGFLRPSRMIVYCEVCGARYMARRKGAEYENKT